MPPLSSALYATHLVFGTHHPPDGLSSHNKTMTWMNNVDKKLTFTFFLRHLITMQMRIPLAALFTYTWGIKLFGTTIEVDKVRRQVKEEEINKSHDLTVEKRPDKIIPCPRCKSMETKFCYFNNYNVNQPRHFCKGCQRYWTAGGALRNVPVGAGRRKAKPPGRGLDGFPESCLIDGSDGFGFDGVVVEEWHVATRGDLSRGFPAKRLRGTASGQSC
ncbi:hypothetical protein LguiA_025118 [Lonicera macranthoides]